MFSPRFYWRYYLSYAALLAVVTLGVAALGSASVERNARRELGRSLEMQASLLREVAAPVVARSHRFPARRDSLSAVLQARLVLLAAKRPARFTIIEADGRVLADSDHDPRSMDDHSERPEIVQARVEGSGSSERFSHTLGERLMYVALSLRDDRGEVLGFARASYPLRSMEEELARLRSAVLRGAVLAVALALGVGWLFTRRLTRPLREIAVAVSAIRSGNYRHRLLIEDDGAVGDLARAFNAMEEQIEEHLRTIENDRQKVFAILEAMPDGVVAVDSQQRILHLNRAGAQAFETDAADAEGQRLWEVVRSSEIQSILDRTLESGTSQSLEARLHLGGASRVFDLRTIALRDAHRQVEGAVLVLQDLSRLRRLEGMRSDFVSNVSHELKTPLTALRGLIESILNDPQMDREVLNGFAGRMHVQTTRLNTLIGDLLNLSRLERDDAPLDRHPIDLCHAAHHSISQLQESITAKELEVRIETTDAEILIEADEESLHQIYDNLLTNAIRYTPEGGWIQVRIRRLENLDQALLEIEDSGIGIESRHHQRIFERFYRVDKARSREAGGTGLGLSIVKHVVARLDGQIQLESVPGQGSCFRVTFHLSRRS